MSYIGNPIVSTDFPKDTFSGNGSTTAFTMQIAPASVNSVIVVVSGITQDPSTYTISGTTLTFSAAPPTGTSNISVRHLGVAGTPNVPADASVTAAKIATGAVGLTQLSATGTASSSTYLRGDNSWATVAGYAGPSGQIFTSSGTFTIPTGVTKIKVTVVGGGGGGGSAQFSGGGGGGGGGGVAVQYFTSLTPAGTLAVTIGAAGSANGGTGGTSSIASGTQSITTLSASGGSGGASANASSGSGGNGGSSFANAAFSVVGGRGGDGFGDVSIGGGGGAAGGGGGVYGGGGASAVGGGGSFGSGGTSGSAGNGGSVGTGYGSGGGGAGNGGTPAANGGAGKAGIVMVEW